MNISSHFSHLPINSRAYFDYIESNKVSQNILADQLKLEHQLKQHQGPNEFSILSDASAIAQLGEGEVKKLLLGVDAKTNAPNAAPPLTKKPGATKPAKPVSKPAVKALGQSRGR